MMELEQAHLKLVKALERMQHQAANVVRHPDPDYPERPEYLINLVMDSAHEILDLAHDFKHAANLKHAK